MGSHIWSVNVGDCFRVVTRHPSTIELLRSPPENSEHSKKLTTLQYRRDKIDKKK